ncbi:MAG TPA: DUF222 domain-containing protein [Galbitalea sp.]
MSIADGLSRHPVRACAAAVVEALTDVASVPVELMSVEDKGSALVELDEAERVIAALRLRILASSSDVAAELGARDAGAWLAHRTQTDDGPRRSDLRLAEALTRRWTRVYDAMAAGRVNRAQAHVIVAALDELEAPDLDPSLLVRAEEHLIELAADFAPKRLRALGRRILDIVAPEIGEAREARALELEERRARDETSLRFHAVGGGLTRIEGVLPDAVAHRLRTYLEAFTSPRHDAAVGGEGDGLPSHRKRGHAFCSLLEAIDPERLPRHGGDATTVIVTVSLESLRAELAVAGVLGADEEPISAAQARRLACNAKIVPVVLGGQSEILDLGRASRLFSPAQRKALRIRDKRCRAKGCATAATWSEAHHLKSWLAGGKTDIANGILLCGFHHHRAHDSGYEHAMDSDGDLEFWRRRRSARE